jgi:3-methyladenine DNA glycosylase AlkD
MEIGLGDMFGKAEHSLRVADHMVYITYPLLKDTKLIKKTLEELSSCTINLINAVLFNEFKKKRITLTRDKKENLDIFKRNMYRFGITREEKEVLETILELIEKHNTSSTEFIRKDSLVILLDNLKTETVTFDRLKLYLNTLKIIIQKLRNYLDKQELPKSL